MVDVVFPAVVELFAVVEHPDQLLTVAAVKFASIEVTYTKGDKDSYRAVRKTRWRRAGMLDQVFGGISNTSSC